MKRLSVFLLLLALSLTGCAGETAQTPATPEPSVSAAPEVTRTAFTLPYFPDASLHPITGNNRSDLVLASLVYQGLFELDNTFTPHGVLCTASTTSDDGLTWSFTLGDSLFSDGSPVTAADAAASLELARGSELYAGRLSDVRSVTAADEKTVLISLSRPNANLRALLDIPVIRDRGDGSMPLGTGPYYFAEDDGPLRLVRSPSAPDTAPEEIPLAAIDSADDLIYAFDAGEVSLVLSDLTGANALGYSSDCEAFDYPTTTMLYVGFQTKTGPCRDALLRRVISRGFDRDTVTVSLLAGHGDATCLPVSPRSSLYSAEHEAAGSFDPAAQEELLQSGYTLGEDGLLYQGRTALTLTMIVNTDNSFKLTVADYLAQQLGALGITVDLQKLSWDDYVTALERGGFDLYLGEVALTADFDLSPLIGHSGALNYGGYSSGDMELLLTQMRSTGETQALLELFQQDAPLAPLCFKSHSVLTQWRAVSGLTPTRQNPFYHLGSLRFST